MDMNKKYVYTKFSFRDWKIIYITQLIFTQTANLVTNILGYYNSTWTILQRILANEQLLYNWHKNKIKLKNKTNHLRKNYKALKLTSDQFKFFLTGQCYPSITNTIIVIIVPWLVSTFTGELHLVVSSFTDNGSIFIPDMMYKS